MGNCSGHTPSQGYGSPVVDIGSRKRNQPAPPHVVFEKLTNPDLEQAKSILSPTGNQLGNTSRWSTSLASTRSTPRQPT